MRPNPKPVSRTNTPVLAVGRRIIKQNKKVLDRLGKKRGWSCPHCPWKNDTAARKCLGCGEKRGAKKTTLRNRADSLFSQYIRARDGKCQRCGTTDRLQCAHLHSRRYFSVRFNPLNAVALCAGCHKWQTERVLEGQDFFMELVGVEPYAELRRLALRGGMPDYVQVIKELSQLLREAKRAA